MPEKMKLGYKEHFDGITCDDRHLTLCLESDKPEVKFEVDYFDRSGDIRDQSTIQFWFQFGDKSFYNPQYH